MKFNFSGKEDEYTYLLRKFTLDKLLKRINIETAELLTSVLFSDVSGTKRVSFPLIDTSTGARKNQEVFLTGWNLVDLAYSSIVCGNDYRGKAISDVNELYLLVSLTESMHQKRESEWMDVDDFQSTPDLFLYLWGFFGEQKKIQQPGKVFDNLSREMYMLLDLAPRIQGVSNIQEIVNYEVGVCAEKIILALFLAWFASTQAQTQKEWEENLIWGETLSLEEFRVIMSRYTATYQDVRSSKLGRQYLYVKPYIQTQNKEIISINCYLNFFLVEHCVLWCVRDYYFRTNSRQFTSEFGLLFEEYFKELLMNTLVDEAYERIPEEKKSRADWRIVLGKYRFLIEQKSPLLGLDAKQQESNLEVMKTFCTRNIVKGINQLGETEKDFGDGPYIKIILLYEDYLYTGIIDHVFALPECKQKNDYLYWLVTIDELETLLFLYHSDEKLFDEIMDKKIAREVTRSNEGKSLSQIFGENGVSKNPYIAQEKFQKHLDRIKHDSLQHVRNTVKIC